MDKSDWYSRKLERDHKAIKAAAMSLHRQGILDEKLLSHTIEKAFNLGHQAGVGRGQLIQKHKNNGYQPKKGAI